MLRALVCVHPPPCAISRSVGAHRFSRMYDSIHCRGSRCRGGRLMVLFLSHFVRLSIAILFAAFPARSKNNALVSVEAGRWIVATQPIQETHPLHLGELWPAG